MNVTLNQSQTQYWYIAGEEYMAPSHTMESRGVQCNLESWTLKSKGISESSVMNIHVKRGESSVVYIWYQIGVNEPTVMNTEVKLGCSESGVMNILS